MKRLALVSVVFFFVAVAILSACSSSNAPTATPVPQPTPTPQPTATLIPTPTPTPTPTPKPTPTPVPTPTPIPIPTPTPTPTPTPKPTPTPTPVPTPTPTTRPVVGQITVQSGTAQYRAGTGGDFAAAANKTGVAIGDRVRSGASSQVAVEFLDGSSLVLLADTEVEIQNYIITRQGDRIVTRVARVAVINGDVSGDIREDLVYPPSVFEIVSAGEIYTIKGTLSQ